MVVLQQPAVCLESIERLADGHRVLDSGIRGNRPIGQHHAIVVAFETQQRDCDIARR
jgi:hypothetical protein